MGTGMDTWLAIAAFFVVIGPLIFVHELGHFLVARWNKIKVEEFGIGYPPRMLTLFEHNGTKYTLNWLPLGGFMRPAGEDDPSIPDGLAAAPKMARLAVLAAGPGANVLAAFVLLIVMFMLGAPERLPGARIAVVEPDSPAASSGLMPNDVILHVGDTPVERSDDLTNYIYSHIGETFTMTVQRGTTTLELIITPRTSWPEGQGPTGIQIQAVYEVRRYGFFPAIGRALREIGYILKTIVQLPAMVIEQQIPARYLRPVSIVGISQLGGQELAASIEQNAAWPIVRLTASISLALAITNLLPIPALDGGRILFVLIEAIRRKRLDPQREMVVHFVGFVILIATMFLLIYLDIVDPLIKP